MNAKQNIMKNGLSRISNCNSIYYKHKEMGDLSICDFYSDYLVYIIRTNCIQQTASFNSEITVTSTMSYNNF